MRSSVEKLFHEVADLPAEARARYFAENHVDPETRSEVEVLLAFDSRSTTSLERNISAVAQTAMARLEPEATLCGPYRVGALLGCGGMGTVHLAERVDGEVTQRVAVKLVRPGGDDPEIRQRFLAERQILAGLSHPNIARLLDAGHREDGQPYLVMEYVEGKPIDVYTTGLDIRHKILLFLKVCSAVAYLHRNLVVHRDLKPANILVTGEGEPKLLDFGIAKMLDLSTDATVTGARMLTPAYASPEQVSGQPVTTATDVYSLGAVLYKLATGTSPHESESESAGGMALAISTGRITPPSRLAPDLKGDLEMVLMKALRREPQERYATIEQFSEDLENCLESRPIRARRGDTWYRSRKFLRRHWPLVTAATLTLASLFAGLVVANRERAIAQQRFVQVRQLANRLFDIDIEVRQAPGTTKARQLIVGTSLEYLRRLAADAHGDADLALELGNAYMRVARVQGVPVNPNLGDAVQADDSLQQAERLLHSVLEVRPGDRIAILRSAQTAHDRMILADYRGAGTDSLEFARRSAKLLGQYERTGTVDPLEAHEVALTYINVGMCYAGGEEYDEAIRLSRRGFEIARAAGDENQAGSSLMSVAEVYRRRGDLERALEVIRESVKMLEPRAGVLDRARTKAFLNALSREGRILGGEESISMGRFKDAVAPLGRAFEIAEVEARRDASDIDSRSRAGTTGLVLADVLRHVDSHRSLAVYDRTLSSLAAVRNNPRARIQEVQALAGSSDPLLRLGRRAEAQQRLDAAFARLRQLKLYPAERIEADSETDRALSARAFYEASQGRTAHAVEIYEELMQKVLLTHPKPESSLTDAVNLSRIYANMAGLNRHIGRSDRASALEAQRLELWRRWDARLPNNTFVRRQLNEASGPAMLRDLPHTSTNKSPERLRRNKTGGLSFED
jgi:serine/threonine protein kinase